jgi:MFS family permease
MTGFGLMIGPLIGGGLYSLGGYTVPFYFTITLSLCILPFIVMMIKTPTTTTEPED